MKTVYPTTNKVCGGGGGCNDSAIQMLDTCFKINETKLQKYEPRHAIFQQCDILTCADSDEPVQPSFRLRNYK